MRTTDVRVCVVGLWHMGCVYSACLASLGYVVRGTDDSSRTLKDLRMGKPPISEPGLDRLLADGVNRGNLVFVNSLQEAVEMADYVVIAYDTPLDVKDRVDPSVILQTAERLKEIASNPTIIVSSQVPVGTCKKMASLLCRSSREANLAYVPENLRLGQAVERFMKPEMIVIGSDNPAATAKARALFSPIETKFFEMDLISAEMTKHALNAFLATSISFANEVGNICDLVGADALKIAEALKSDSRIGPKALLKPGLGFSGGTLARDLRILQEKAGEYGCNTDLIDAVLDVNERQNASIIDRLEQLVGELSGKRIAVLGLTYKSGTSTLRRSAALEIIRDMQQKGAFVKAFDPNVSKSDLESKTFLLCEDAYATCENADAIVIMNDLPEFGDLDFERLRKLIRNPLVLDTQNLLERGKTIGYFRVVGIGRGSLDA